MKHNARLWQCMTPRNRLDSITRFLKHVAKSLRVGHFGALVIKNWATLRKIRELIKVRQACINEASLLGVNEEDLRSVSTAEKLKLQSQGRAGGGSSFSDEANDQIAFVIVAIQVKLLTGVKQMEHAAIFFWDHPSATAMTLATRKAEERMAGLLERRLTSLCRLGYTSADHSWLALPAFASLVTSACQREKSTCEGQIEKLVEEYATFSAELRCQSEKPAIVSILKKQQSSVRKKIIALMKLYLWWASFSVADGAARLGWDTTAATVDALLKETSPESTRVFPWDTMVSGGSKPLPRRLVLKFINAVEELARSIEEWKTFLPSSLLRAIRYVDVFV